MGTEEIFELVKSGMSLSRIASNLGVTRKAISNRLNRNYSKSELALYDKTPKTSPDAKEFWNPHYEKYKNGSTLKEISTETGISRPTVTKIFKKLTNIPGFIDAHFSSSCHSLVTL